MNSCLFVNYLVSSQTCKERMHLPRYSHPSLSRLSALLHLMLSLAKCKSFFVCRSLFSKAVVTLCLPSNTVVKLVLQVIMLPDMRGKIRTVRTSHIFIRNDIICIAKTLKVDTNLIARLPIPYPCPDINPGPRSI